MAIFTTKAHIQPSMKGFKTLEENLYHQMCITYVQITQDIYMIILPSIPFPIP